MVRGGSSFLKEEEMQAFFQKAQDLENAVLKIRKVFGYCCYPIFLKYSHVNFCLHCEGIQFNCYENHCYDCGNTGEPVWMVEWRSDTDEGAEKMMKIVKECNGERSRILIFPFFRHTSLVPVCLHFRRL